MPMAMVAPTSHLTVVPSRMCIHLIPQFMEALPTSSSTSGTAAEEERVMGECSFFYDMDKINEDEISTTAATADSHTKSHRISGTDPPSKEEDDEESKGYSEQKRPHYRNGRVRWTSSRANPRRR
mmetsp:Transcript_5032/g.8983  ORF Transcript_5032/g.8983 Transcript_5032/m.8983 type:complete len:125 (+) Transcript_5032:221-595(+)